MKEKIKRGDSIYWYGNFINGFKKGINIVSAVYVEDGLLWMKLDNGIKFILKNLKNPSSKPPKGWDKLNK